PCAMMLVLARRRHAPATHSQAAVYHPPRQAVCRACARRYVNQRRVGVDPQGPASGPRQTGTASRMRYGRETACALARSSVVALACITLANCSSQQRVGKLDPKLGVSPSPRVVEPGQPVPKGGGVYRVGKPYVVAGRTYYPEENIRYRAEGLASWYGDDFHGRLTANREVYDMHAISAAHPTLPMPSYARVTNLANGKSLVVRVNDRGPYHQGREIDLSAQAADLLGYKGRGTTRVRVEYIGPAPLEGTDDRQLIATLRDGEPAPAPSGVRRPLLADLFRPSPIPRRGAPTPQE